MTLRQRLAGVGALRFALRARALWWDREMARRKPGEALHFLFRSKEVANFTYELANEDEAPAFLAKLLGRDEAEIAGYLAELRADDELTSDLRGRLRGVRRRNSEPLLGKRRLQYCIVRVEKPGLVVESGVHDGLGTAVLLRALERNEAEGALGRLIALDVHPDAGWLVDADEHGQRLEMVTGDTRQTLGPALAGEQVGFFIHDSLKTHEHETFELETAAAARKGRQVLYTDDASATGAMAEVSERHGGRWEAFVEQPVDHYWKGNAVGICVLD